MNRLAPLISRSPDLAAPPRRAWAPRGAYAGPMPVSWAQPMPAWTNDLKLFATVWVGGLVFFGTLLA
jgi:hypothetical protein